MASESSNSVSATSSSPSPITRRRFDRAWKQAIIEQALRPGASVAKLARENDLNTNQLFEWCRLHERTRGGGTPTQDLLPVTIETSASASALPTVPVIRLSIELARGTLKLEGTLDLEVLRTVMQTLASR